MIELGLLSRVALSFFFAAVSLASACAQTEPPVRGGTLVAIIQPEPTALISIINNNYPNAFISANVFDGLVTYDAAFAPQPGLAESWDVAPDGLSVTFHLRRGVKWHDGHPFTSKDVRYSVLELWKKFHSRGRTTYAAVQDVETPDDDTAVFRLSHPSLVIFSALTAAESPVLPSHIYEGSDFLKNPQNNKPIGTGPFVFKEWRKGQYIELDRNPDYWVSGRPFLDRVIVRNIPDAASRATALETGEALYAPFDAVPFADVERLRKIPGLTVDTRGYDFMSQFLMIEFNLSNPYLSSLKVREAIAHAIDTKGLINTVWYGLARPATGPVPSQLAKFYTGDVPRYAFDPARAEQLLDEAGFPRKADGVRFAISQDFLPFNDAFKNSSDYMRQNLKRVGIEMTVRAQDLPAYLRRIYTDYDFDTLLTQFSPMADPEMGLFRVLLSTNHVRGIPNMQASGYSSPEADALIAQISVERDPATRSGLFRQLQGVVQHDLPILPLTEMQHVTIRSTKLKDVNVGPDGALASLRDVWIAP